MEVIIGKQPIIFLTVIVSFSIKTDM